MPSLSFEICGVPISLAAREPRLINLFAEYFRYYHPQLWEPTPDGSSSLAPSSDAAAPLIARLKMRRTLPPLERLLPRAAALLAQTSSLRLWRAEDGPREVFYFHAGPAAFRLDPASSRLEGLIAPEALRLPHLLANTYTLFALLLLLRARGLYHLHAAAVLSPHDELYLICGEEGTGKTTLATALGLAGWRPISDDSLLLRAAGGSPQLAALKKTFHLADHLLARWPALADIPRRHHYLARTGVAGLEFFGTTLLADASFARAAYLILPQITRRAASELLPVPLSEGILKLAEQSMFFQLWRAHTEQHLRLLTQLVGAAAGFRLLAGTDLLAHPQHAADLLRSCSRG
jgi:hypothetical protein